MDKICNKCGKYLNDSASLYCPVCGNSMMELPENKTGYTNNRNGWIYFVVNAVILLSLTLSHIQKVEFIFLILGMILLWNFIVREKKEIYSISQKLAGIVFIDVLLVFIAFSDVWLASMRGNLLSDLSKNSGQWFLFVMIGIIFYAISAAQKTKKKLVFQWIAFECFGLIFVFTWGWTLDYWSGYIKVFFLIYTILNFVWCVILKTALSVRYIKTVEKRWMTFAFFGILIFLRFFCRGVIEQYLLSFSEKITMFCSVNLNPVRIILLLILLLGAALIIRGGEKKRCGCDALVLAGIAFGIILLKATTVFFFPFAFLALFIYGFVFLYLMKQEMHGIIRFPDINRLILLGIITISFIASLYLISMGLWLLVLVGLIFVKILVPKMNQPVRKYFTVWILSFIMSEAVLAIYLYKMHAEAYLSVLVIFISFLLILRMITWKHPSVKINRKAMKISMCIIFALFMFLAVFKNGTAIDITYNKDNNQVSANIEAKGKENSIDSVSYCWSNSVLLSENSDMLELSKQSVNKKNININAGTPSGKCLVIMTVDKNGVRTERKVFIPSFFYTLKNE